MISVRPAELSEPPSICDTNREGEVRKEQTNLIKWWA